jgi:hypothetical protein
MMDKITMRILEKAIIMPVSAPYPTEKMKKYIVKKEKEP